MKNQLKIDAVILYADKKPRLRHKLQSQWIKGSTPLSINRTRDNGELKYLLRSLKFLPWLNNIYLVVAEKAPDYIDTTKIRVIRHRDFYSKNWRLPTYNSAQIQSQIHRIHGLEERFLLLDDDFVFLEEVPHDFFFPDLNIVSIPRGKGTLSIDFGSQFDNTASFLHHNCNKYLPEISIPRQRFWHHAKPLIKSMSHKVYEFYLSEINLMKNSISRNKILDVFLYELFYYSLYEKLIDSDFEIRFQEVEDCKASIAHLLDSEKKTQEAFLYALSTKPKFLCVNDDMGRVANNKSLDVYREYMNIYLNEKSFYEK